MDYLLGLTDGVIISVMVVAFLIGNAITFFVINLMTRFNRLVAAVPSCLFWSGAVIGGGLFLLFFRQGNFDSADIALYIACACLPLFFLAIIVTYLIIIRYNYSKANISSTYKHPQEIINPTCYLSTRYGVRPNSKGSVWLRTRAELNYYSVNPIANTERNVMRQQEQLEKMSKDF